VPDLTDIATRVMAEWRARYADWDVESFANAVAASGTTLAQALGTDVVAERVVEAHLRLVAEALRLGYVDRSSALAAAGSLPASNLLARCLLDVIPRRLPTYAADRQLALLAETWNLCEGLLQQPPWMGRLANTLISDADDLEHLGVKLAATITPFLVAPRAASFAGPFGVHVLDLRDIDDDFLPGSMHAAAPAVLCVHDRLRREVQGAVVLTLGGSSRSLGAAPCLAEAADSEDLPSAVEVWVGEGKAAIAGRELPLPTVHTAHAHVALPSGFVAVSAVDSQRLWIVESAS
jgi:hypothetical protein